MTSTIKHYFGSNLKHYFYRNWDWFQVECGIKIDRRDKITYDKRRVSCKNCKKILNLK